jgi:MoxR-like ATPase
MRRISDMKFDFTVNTVLTKEDIFSIRDQVNRVKMSESLERYIIELVYATRKPLEYKLNEQAPYIQFGASPRASINLNLASKAFAYMDGRDYVLPEDIKEVALDVMGHRIILNYEAEADNVKTSDVVKAILNKVPINK